MTTIDYIPKSVLLAEIERLVNNYDKALDYEAALEDVRDFIDNLELKDVNLQEEPVNEELEKAAVEAFKQIVDSDKNNFLEIFKAGVNWQAEQFEKNRLAACDRQAEEEAEIERDFVMGIIENEHRQPTFDDAIKYGMRLQKKQMMAKSIGGGCFSYKNGFVHISCDIDEHLTDIKMGDKIKLVIIKQD